MHLIRTAVAEVNNFGFITEATRLQMTPQQVALALNLAGA